MDFNLEQHIGQLTFDEPQVSGKMSIFPLFQKAENKEGVLLYLLLEEALQTGLFEVEEVSMAGNVNMIVVNNKAAQSVLILDGEELLGAKQNRMVNATVLIPAHQEVKIPVSCVERGRWRYSSERFDRAGAFGYSRLRRQKVEQVTSSLNSNRGFSTDQGDIWAEIDDMHARRHTESSTSALHDAYVRRDQDLQAMIANFHHQEGQTGLAFFINHNFVCLDCFDRADILAKLWPRLLKSYAMEALDGSDQTGKEMELDLTAVLEAISTSRCSTYPSVGLGVDIRLQAESIVGAGLALEERVIHLSVFRKEAEERTKGMPEGRIHRPSRRRRTI